ncbi:MAG: GTPase HflX, partial [Anaerolineaceae bacterium]|nr:GTPase HflX [Anaerolineaceae bacterium]
MMSNVQNLILTNPGDEFAILVGVNLPDLDKLLTLEDSMDELELLAKTANVEVIGRLTQNLDKPNSKTYLGSGKVEELKMLAEELSANLVIFDEELSPRNQRELEEILGDDIKIIDR